MKIADYENITTQTGLYPESGTGSLIAVNYCALGLGEAGEIQGKVKKIWRGDPGMATLPGSNRIPFQAREAILDEAGDVLWYLTRLCLELGVGLEHLMERNAEKVLDRKKRNLIQGSGDNR